MASRPLRLGLERSLALTIAHLSSSPAEGYLASILTAKMGLRQQQPSRDNQQTGTMNSAALFSP